MCLQNKAVVCLPTSTKVLTNVQLPITCFFFLFLFSDPQKWSMFCYFFQILRDQQKKLNNSFTACSADPVVILSGHWLCCPHIHFPPRFPVYHLVVFFYPCMLNSVCLRTKFCEKFFISKVWIVERLGMVYLYCAISINSAGPVTRYSPAEILVSARRQNGRDSMFFSAHREDF